MTRSNAAFLALSRAIFLGFIRDKASVFFAILFGVPESTPVRGRSLDTPGFIGLTLALLAITGGLTFLKLNGVGAWWAWVIIALGVLAFIPWGRFELRQQRTNRSFIALARRCQA